LPTPLKQPCLCGRGSRRHSSATHPLEVADSGTDANAVGQAVISVRNNTPILLRDVADIKIAPAIRFGDSLIMGRPGVLLSLASQYGANTLNTTLEVEKALAGLEPGLKKQGIQMYTSLHRPATFIERALQNLKESLVIAAVLILAVLYLFLRDARAAFIAFTGNPFVSPGSDLQFFDTWD